MICPKRNRENKKIMNVMKENDAGDPSFKGDSVDASESLANQLRLVASLGYDSCCSIVCIQKKQSQRRKTSLSFNIFVGDQPNLAQVMINQPGCP